MNTQKMIFFVMVLTCILNSNLFAIDWKAYQKAVSLAKEKRYKEAISIWQKTKANAKNDKDDAFYMKMAAQVALRKLKDKNLAVDLVKSIKSEERRNVELMNYLSANEIILKFKDADFSKYPEDIRLEANFRIANAYFREKMFKEALAQYDKALACNSGNPSSRGNAALRAGDICLKKDFLDIVKAETYYRKSLAASKAPFAWRCEALIRLTNLLLKQKKTDEALKIHDEKIIAKAIPYWKVQLSYSYSTALAAAGQSSKAIEILNSAMKFANTLQKKTLQKQINKISDSLL